MVPALQPIVDFLNVIDKWVDEIPPLEQPMRFGNKAFRTLIDKMKGQCDELMFQWYPVEGFKLAIPELKEYFLDSFGSYERIDYGTGHELNFMLVLLCLFKL